MKQIYLIRHGETEFNRKGIMQGSSVDSSLNDVGQAQARAFYEKYKNVEFDKVYTSVLKRSQESVQKFIDKGIPHEAFVELNEINWGNSDGVNLRTNDDKEYRTTLASWKAGDVDFKIEGGESPAEVYERVGKAMKKILSRTDEDTILICMHGRAMRILLSLLMQTPLKDMDVYEHHNLGLYRLTYENDKHTMEAKNCIIHLAGLND